LRDALAALELISDADPLAAEAARLKAEIQGILLKTLTHDDTVPDAMADRERGRQGGASGG
jgi:hypothetical protein